MSGQRVVFSAQKDEGPFLLEWVAYHRVLGFDRIVVFSNDCTDGSDDLLDAMAAEGLIEHHLHSPPDGTAPQANAAAQFLEICPPNPGDWLIWLDSDEFLVPGAGMRSLDDLLSSDDFDAISIPWRIFGDSGNPTWPGRHISADFTMAARLNRKVNHPTKCLFRVEPQLHQLGIHRPVFDGLEPEGHRWIFASGEPVPPAYYKPGDGGGPSFVPAPGPKNYAKAQIAHFRVRTWDMFSKKAQRGDGYFNDDAAPDRDRAFFDDRNQNVVVETGHLTHERAITAMMDDWANRPGIASALAKVEGFRLRSAALDEALRLGPKDPVQICDVGANPLDQEAAYAPLLREGFACVTGFEPQESALARLNAMKSGQETYLPDALGTGDDITLHIFRSSGFTSKYPADAGTQAAFLRYEHFTKETGQVPVPTRRLDDIAEVPDIDILKIDVQGSERDIIAHGREKLKSALAVQTEVRFFPIYEGEPDWGELHLELVAQGFRLHSFAHMSTVTFNAPHAPRVGRRNRQQLIDGDAIYIRDLRQIAQFTERQLRVLFVFAARMLRSEDLVLYALAELVRRNLESPQVMDDFAASCR